MVLSFFSSIENSSRERQRMGLCFPFFIKTDSVRVIWQSKSIILRGTSLFTATPRTRKEFLPCQGFSWPGGRTIGALRAERQISTSANGTSCSARHELRSRAFLFIIVSAECALPTNASFFTSFARILTNAPPPHDTLRTCFVCATHAHSHFCPQHWLLFCVIWVCISSSSSSNRESEITWDCALPRRIRRTEKRRNCFCAFIGQVKAELRRSK